MTNNQQYRALVVEESADGTFTRDVRTRDIADLPAGDVLVRVDYSSLNFKDALSATGNKGVTRNYPHTPGIDAAGVVEHSTVAEFAAGEPVIVTSYDLGMNTPGGFGRYIRVPAEWVVPLPAGLSLKQSMILGTAGFTAGMSVDVLVRSIKPDDGEILVTGASGGVGSVAVAILAGLGYPVVAVSGKPAGAAFLEGLGAKSVIGRDEAMDSSDRPMLKPRWAGVVDTVGGDILTTAIRSTRPFGVVTCCGMVASSELDLTVFPFILRGVTLAGINSQACPMAPRRRIWESLAGDWKLDDMEALSDEVTLVELSDRIDLILQGQVTGRVVVNLEDE